MVVKSSIKPRDMAFRDPQLRGVRVIHKHLDDRPDADRLGQRSLR